MNEPETSADRPGDRSEIAFSGFSRQGNHDLGESLFGRRNRPPDFRPSMI
jgi:hypothetical protein